MKGTRFKLDGKETFLLGISYYGGCGASSESVRRDLDRMRHHGFNWIRVWATWNLVGGNVSAVDRQGRAREPYLGRLKRLVEEARKRGMVVDVTLSRGECLPDQASHLRAVQTLAKALKPYRNLYFDLGNERNIGDARHVPFDDLRVLRERVEKIDRDSLLTASHAGDISRQDVRRYLQTAGVDFLAPHRPRRADSPARTKDKTRQYLRWVREMGRAVPLHYQEPFRRDFGRWQPRAEDFLEDARGAVEGGAAGWCLHNGSPRGPHEEGSARSFDLRERSLFEQLDSHEMKVVRRLADHLGS